MLASVQGEVAKLAATQARCMQQQTELAEVGHSGSQPHLCFCDQYGTLALTAHGVLISCAAQGLQCHAGICTARGGKAGSHAGTLRAAADRAGRRQPAEDWRHATQRAGTYAYQSRLSILMLSMGSWKHNGLVKLCSRDSRASGHTGALPAAADRAGPRQPAEDRRHATQHAGALAYQFKDQR